MAITLPGYHAAFPNRVYTKEDNIHLPDGNKFEGTRVLLFHRFTGATEDETILYIQAKERELPPEISSPAALQALAPVERAVMRLPTEVRERLRKGDSNLIHFLKMHTPAPALRPGDLPSRYLFLTKGYLPTKMIDANEKWGNIHTSDWYRLALQQDDLKEARMGEQWLMKIKYTDEGLPPRSEMDVLARHGVYSSETISISILLRQELYTEIIDTLYAGFSTLDQITLLEDRSQRALESAAVAPLQDLLGNVEMSSLVQALESARVIPLGGQNSSLDGREDETKKRWN